MRSQHPQLFSVWSDTKRKFFDQKSFSTFGFEFCFGVTTDPVVECFVVQDLILWSASNGIGPLCVKLPQLSGSSPNPVLFLCQVDVSGVF